MGIHDLGYRRWSGTLAPRGLRWAVIARTGVRRAWQSKWLRRMLVLAWLPTLWFGLGFFIWEQSVLYPDWRDGLRPFLNSAPRTGPLGDLIEGAELNDPEAARHAVWSWLLQTFFRYPQGVIMAIAVGIIAPPLISQDARSRAFLLYFSRPLTRGEYTLGKLATVWFFLATIATVPALNLYLLGILLSPSLEVVQATWDLPLRIIAASAVLMIPSASLALCLSSLTQESRYAVFGWFAIWILGWFTYGILTSLELNAASQPLQDQLTRWIPLSLYHMLGQVQSWIFGFTEFQDITLSLGILVTVTIVSLLILLHRVAAPMRA